jgi:hypothetical protein
VGAKLSACELRSNNSHSRHAGRILKGHLTLSDKVLIQKLHLASLTKAIYMLLRKQRLLLLLHAVVRHAKYIFNARLCRMEDDDY